MEQTEQRSQFRHLRAKDYIAISIFWMGISLHWGAFLTIIMQARVGEMVDPLVKGTYLGVLSAVGALISTVVELVAGPISDRCQSPLGRRRPFILWGTLLSLPFILLFMTTNSFWVLVFHFVMIQMFLNWANGPYQAVIPDQVPPQKHGLASAHMGMMSLLGNAIGLAIAGLTFTENPFLFKNYDYSHRLIIVGWILIAALLLTMLWTVIGLKENRWVARSPQDARITLAHMFDIRLGEHRDFMFVILSRFAFNLGFTTVIWYLFYYLQDSIKLKGDAPLYAFIIMEIAIVAGVVGNWYAGVLSDTYSKKTVMYLCSLVLGVATLFFLFTQSLIGVFVLGIVFGIAWGGFQAVDWALASNLVPTEEAGRYMAIWHIAMTVPQVIAPLIAGPIGDAVNRSYGMGVGWRVVFGIIPLYLIAGVILLRYVNERPVAK
jgi:Na+/melibiose symporter-like transporter